MSEQFIPEYIPHRMKQLGYSRWFVRHRDFGVAESSEIVLSTSNELFIIVGDPQGFEVESDYGLYVSGPDEFLEENAHEHKGNIRILNVGDSDNRITMIQVIIVN